MALGNSKTIKNHINHNRVFEHWPDGHILFPGEKKIRRARRILAERLGRSLKSNEHAHHKDGNTLNDDPKNIVRKWVGQHTREHHRGKIVSAETRQKLSELHLNPSAETRRKLSDANRRRRHSLETRHKISETLKHRFASCCKENGK